MKKKLHLFIFAILLMTNVFIVSSQNKAFAETVNVVSVNLDQSEITIEIGQSKQLQAIVSPSNASNKEVIWNSKEEEIATVDASGRVTGIKEGTTSITVITKDGFKMSYCTVNVKGANVAVTGIALNKNTLNIDPEESQKILATIYPYNATNKNIKWISSNPSIATVDQYGNVTGVKEGSAFITAVTEDGFKSAYCDVSVKSDWQYWTFQENVPTYKEWTIKFNMQVDPNTVENNVYVMNAYGNKENVKLFAEGNEIVVRPVDVYDGGSGYFLYITKNVKSINGKSLTKGIRMPFTTKN